METVDPQPGDWRRVRRTTLRARRARSLLVSLAAGVILVILVGATNSVVAAARSISTDARDLSRTDEEIRAATVARTLVVLASVTVEQGGAAPALDEVDAARAVLGGDPETAEFASAVAALGENLRTAGTLDQTGPAPDPALVAAVENTFGDTTDTLMARRADLAAALQASDDRLESINMLAGFALLFAVPALTIGVYRAVTKPDLDHEATAHAAEVQTARDRRRNGAIADQLAALRAALTHGAAPAVIDQQLDELAAITGPGAGVRVRHRRAVDLRQAVVSAVNRVEISGAVPVTGGTGSAHTDPEELTVLLAAVLSSAEGLRDPRIELSREGDHLVATITGIGGWDVEAILTAPSPWDLALATGGRRRLAAARELAVDLDATLTPVDEGGRVGVRIALPAAPGADPVDAPPPVAAGATP